MIIYPEIKENMKKNEHINKLSSVRSDLYYISRETLSEELWLFSSWARSTRASSTLKPIIKISSKENISVKIRGVSSNSFIFLHHAHPQFSQARCGWWVQRSYRTDQLPVLLRRGSCCHWEGGEAVVSADQRHTQTLPGTHVHTRILHYLKLCWLFAIFIYCSPLKKWFFFFF